MIPLRLFAAQFAERFGPTDPCDHHCKFETLRKFIVGQRSNGFEKIVAYGWIGTAVFKVYPSRRFRWGRFLLLHLGGRNGDMVKEIKHHLSLLPKTSHNSEKVQAQTMMVKNIFIAIISPSKREALLGARRSARLGASYQKPRGRSSKKSLAWKINISPKVGGWHRDCSSKGLAILGKAFYKSKKDAPLCGKSKKLAKYPSPDFACFARLDSQ